MKKLFALLLAMVILLSLVGCGGGSTGSDEEFVINLWHLNVDETDNNRITIEEFIKQYEADHSNVKVVQHILQDADYKDKLLIEFSGSAESVDVFTYWGAGRAGDLVEAGKLLCLEDYISANKLNIFKPGVDTNFRYDGKLYGMPQASWMMVLYCNTELFEKYDVKLPETFDEWLTACETFAKNNVIPVALGGGVDDGWQAAFVYEALVNRIVGAAEEMNVISSGTGYDAPGFKEAAEKMAQLNAAGAFGKSPLEIDEDTSNVQFLSGVAAMRLTGSWFTGGIYTDEDSVVEGKVVALPIPMVTGGAGKDTDYVGGFIDGIFVNGATEHPKECAEFAYELGIAMATSQHEIGEGFTAYTLPVNEDELPPLGKEVAALANKMIDGVVAWDTFLPGDKADLHIDACQALLKKNPDIAKFLAVYDKVFK